MRCTLYRIEARQECWPIRICLISQVLRSPINVSRSHNLTSTTNWINGSHAEHEPLARAVFSSPFPELCSYEMRYKICWRCCDIKSKYTQTHIRKRILKLYKLKRWNSNECIDYFLLVLLVVVSQLNSVQTCMALNVCVHFQSQQSLHTFGILVLLLSSTNCQRTVCAYLCWYNSLLVIRKRHCTTSNFCLCCVATNGTST